MDIGIKGTGELTVTPEKTAKAMTSGAAYVFATPAMLAFMEHTAFTSVLPFLEEGQATVGTGVNLKHIASTPVGMKVRCETELVAINGRALSFTFKVFDEKELIGEGTHERFIIFTEKFQAKADAKLNG